MAAATPASPADLLRCVARFSGRLHIDTLVFHLLGGSSHHRVGPTNADVAAERLAAAAPPPAERPGRRSDVSRTTPELLESRRQALLAAKRLTADIQRCASWQQLRALHDTHRGALNAIHLTALLTMTAKLCAGSDATGRGGRVHSGVARSDSGGWRVPLDQRPHVAAFVEELTSASHVAMVSFSPRHLSNSLWALARLRTRPPDYWLGEWLSALARKLGACRPHDLALSLHALASLQVQPPAAWLVTFCAALDEHLPGYKPQDLALTAWAFATLRHSPGRKALASLAAAAHGQLHLFRLQELATLAWAFASLGHHPGSAWLDDACAAAAAAFDKSRDALRQEGAVSSSSSTSPSDQAGLGASSGQALAQLAWARAKLGHSRGEEWLAWLERATRPLLDEASGAAVAATGGGSEPTTGFRPQQPRREGLAPADLAQLVWSLAALRHQPSHAWLRAYVATCCATSAADRLSRFGGGELAMVMWSLGKLHAPVSPPTARALLAEAACRVKSLDPHSLSLLLTGLAHLCDQHAERQQQQQDGLQPQLQARRKERLDDGDVNHHEGEGLRSNELAATAAEPLLERGALAKAFLPLCEHRALATVYDAQRPEDLVYVCWAMCKLGRPPREELAHVALEHMASRLDVAPPGVVTVLLWMLARVHLSGAGAPCAHRMSLLARHVAANFPAYSESQLNRVCWALLVLPSTPVDALELINARLRGSPTARGREQRPRASAKWLSRLMATAAQRRRPAAQQAVNKRTAATGVRIRSDSVAAVDTAALHDSGEAGRAPV